MDEDLRVFVTVDSPPLSEDRASTGGVSFVDYDGDGDPDIYITNGYDVSSPEPAPQPNVFYENVEGQYEARTIEGLAGVEGYSSGSVWIDFDNDGDLDTFIANQRDQENVYLIRETADDGTPRFEARAADQLAEHKGWSYSVAAADIDRDGFVDIFVSNGGLSHNGMNYLYRNTGDGGLRAVPDAEPTLSEDGSNGASFADFDNDGDQDLAVANRPSAGLGGSNIALYRNDGDLQLTRIDDAIAGDAAYPVAVAWGDIDNDGDQDLYVGNLFGMANTLYENLGDGSLQAMDGGRATTDGGSSYGVALGDLDNDADLDIVVANWGGGAEIYLNDASGHFEQIDGAAYERSIQYASSLALADYDSDGDLDILIGNWPNQPGEGLEENVLIENRYANGNWLRVSLEGVTSNRSAIGARVMVEYRVNDSQVRQMREVNAHSGWRSQGELTQHFGLGEVTAVESVTVLWPSGNTQTVANPAINQELRIREDG